MLYFLPRINKESFIHSFIHSFNIYNTRGPSLWNTLLTENLKILTSEGLYKRKLNDILLDLKMKFITLGEEIFAEEILVEEIFARIFLKIVKLKSLIQPTSR